MFNNNEALLQKGLEMIELEERLEMVNVAAAATGGQETEALGLAASLLCDFGAAAAASVSPEGVYYDADLSLSVAGVTVI